MADGGWRVGTLVSRVSTYPLRNVGRCCVYTCVLCMCGSMNGADVTVASGAVGDSSTCGGMLIVETSIPLFEQSGFGTFRVNASAPLVHVQTFDVRFSGYPQYSPSTIGTIHENVGLGVVQLGLVECLDTGSKVFHHATANAIAWLSENALGQREYDVTSATTFTSDSAGRIDIAQHTHSGTPVESPLPLKVSSC